MDIREELLRLHEEIHGGNNEFSKDKSDMELVVELIDCLNDSIENAKDHSHNIM